MTDMRDAVFQRDPFEVFWSKLSQEKKKNDKLFFAIQEDKSMTIGRCYWNKIWVQKCFPMAIFS